MIPIRDQRQAKVRDWVVRVFGEEQIQNSATRGMRVLEEATELAQAMGVTHEQAIRVIEKTFSRSIGVVAQEIGGLSVTLLAAGASCGLSVDLCEVMEITRIHHPDVERKAQQRELQNRKDGTA